MYEGKTDGWKRGGVRKSFWMKLTRALEKRELTSLKNQRQRNEADGPGQLVMTKSPLPIRHSQPAMANLPQENLAHDNSPMTFNYLR